MGQYHVIIGYRSFIVTCKRWEVCVLPIYYERRKLKFLKRGQTIQQTPRPLPQLQFLCRSVEVGEVRGSRAHESHQFAHRLLLAVPQVVVVVPSAGVGLVAVVEEPESGQV